jgi:penicillin-binding protein 2
VLIFDQLKKSDPHLRVMTVVFLGGLGVLLAGLWWVQIVSARDYQANLETQSFRTVRIPAVRGKILDRESKILAENRPVYNISLYLEELRKPFEQAYLAELSAARAELKREVAAQEKMLGRPLNKHERKSFLLSSNLKANLRQKSRCGIASNVAEQVSLRLQAPLRFDAATFERHYQSRLALPYPLVPNVDPTNIARFAEQSTSPLGVDLEVQSTRVYPHRTTAAHLLGQLRRDDSSAEGEDAFFSYRLPDFRGVLGIEYGFDKELRGMAGAKSVLVNNVGYRQTENVWSQGEPGKDLVLTIDLDLQQVAEQALQTAPLISYSQPARGAAVVMDVRTGDILVLASSPTLDPNGFIHGFTHEEWNRINDEQVQAQKNRATQERYAPGSIFKLVVALAALEAGLDPKKVFAVPANPADPRHGYIRVGNRVVRDTAPPGDYDFVKALKLSSNTYFITNGLLIGPERIIRLGERFHLGESIGLHLNQETAGNFPSPKQLSLGWAEGNTANMCIGQDPVLVSPLQIAVLTAAIANGGTVLWPRLVDRIQSPSPIAGESAMIFPQAQVRDQLGVSPRSLAIVHEAMVADTEDKDGTGWQAAVPGLRICGKTGTAQIQDERNRKTGQTTWFASFAPLEQPKYTVVVMVEDGKSGGDTCAPVAGKIYAAILDREKRLKSRALAKASLPQAGMNR